VDNGFDDLLTLYDGEPTIPQLHNYHNDIDCYARFRYSLGASRFAETLSRAIRDMRDRYLLAYTPDGVSRSGRQTLSVNLTRAKEDIVARPGYWVSSR
jgi:hypothetical protein